MLLDKAQVCERLNITRRHLEDLIRTRRIPFVYVGRLIRFDPPAIDAWVKDQSVPAGAAVGHEDLGVGVRVEEGLHGHIEQSS